MLSISGALLSFLTKKSQRSPHTAGWSVECEPYHVLVHPFSPQPMAEALVVPSPGAVGSQDNPTPPSALGFHLHSAGAVSRPQHIPSSASTERSSHACFLVGPLTSYS